MKKFFVVAVLVVFVAGIAGADDLTGFVSDAKCARAAAGHKGCAQKCVAAGQAAVLVTEDKKVYKIHNPDSVKNNIGDKITATGKVDGDSIHIDSLKPAS